LEKFAHFFEFIAAINSAYIVSDTFMESLLKKINGGLMSLKGTLRKTENDWKNNIKYFQDLVSVDKLGNETKNEYQEKLMGLINRITVTKDELNKALQNKPMFHNFNYWCLFSCLFCVLILVLNGYQYDYEKKYRGYYLIAFGILTALITLISLMVSRGPKNQQSNKKRFTQSYNGVVTIFFLCLIILPLLMHFARYIFGGLPFANCIKPMELIVVKTVCLILVVGHFFFYYILAFVIVITKCYRLRPEVLKIEKERADLMENLRTIANAIDDFKTTKGNNGNQ